MAPAGVVGIPSVSAIGLLRLGAEIANQHVAVALGSHHHATFLSTDETSQSASRQYQIGIDRPARMKWLVTSVGTGCA